MKKIERIQHVFIVGSKGIPGAYGGYETFVDKLTEYHQEISGLQYHVACKGKGRGDFIYHNAHCFQLHVPDIGAAQAILYDIAALRHCCRYIKENNIKSPIIYILACRIGLFSIYYQKRIHALGGKLIINPDGHEFLRSKWTPPVRMYWKLSEQIMVKHADRIICDSINIEKYIHKCYEKYRPSTAYIAYGAELRKSQLEKDTSKLDEWYREKKLARKRYYLIVGRFIPENNYETMIREFMQSRTDKYLAVITTVNDSLFVELERKLHFKEDPRIKFVGTVYDKELLMEIREGAYAYIHGHEVGGTNPSLLEALGSTELNLLLDVGFNREVAEDGALYWTKEKGSLSDLIDKAEQMNIGEIYALGDKARKRIKQSYSWNYIADQYKKLFLSLF